MIKRSLLNLFDRKRNIIDSYQRAMIWIFEHSVAHQGVFVSHVNSKPYPEVSGYLIPTLLDWGERELAYSYARWLVSIQNQDGSWSDPNGYSPYTFDTGQILKGLIVLLDAMPELEAPVRRGCDWLLTQIQGNGRIVTPDVSHWNLPGGRVVPEAIHLYALSPLRTAGTLFGQQEYLDAVTRGIDYYIADPALVSFATLSHFHAYIIEGLIDLGHEDIAQTGMADIARLQKGDGAVPAYNNVDWVCSTGLFQYALIWYKLGDVKRGDMAFSSAITMQNSSGGFYGSRGWGASYFPRVEISWAVKYFLDALTWKIRSGFDSDVALFPVGIAESDGRYRLVAESIRSLGARHVLEAGCGKGRFLRQLGIDFPSVRFTGLDLSTRMLDALPESVTPLWGSLLNIPCPNGTFDFVFCVEALEHAVNIAGALRELARVLSNNGMLVIIDKNRERLGRLKLSEWEQWFLENEVADLLRQQGLLVEIVRDLPYDDSDGRDGLFLGWVARKPGVNQC